MKSFSLTVSAVGYFLGLLFLSCFFFLPCFFFSPASINSSALFAQSPANNIVTLRFPDVSLGKAKIVRPALSTGTDWAKDSAFALKGLVKLRADERLHVKLNYYGATHLEALRICKPFLRRLECGHLEVDDKGAAIIGEFTELAELDISGTDISDKGVQQLSNLRKLEEVNLSFLDLSRSGLRTFTNMPGLTRLTMNGARLGDDSAEEISKMKKLRILWPIHALVTDRFIERIAGLTDLEEIYIQRNDITDSGVKKLLAFKKLRRVNLSDTKVTVQGLLVLKQLPRLEAILFRVNGLSSKDRQLLGTLKGVALEDGTRAKDYDADLFAPVH